MNTTTQTSKKKDIEAIYPLSPMQQGMLFHSLYNPESKVYLSQLQITLQGNLDINAFKLAWQKVVERHGILRSCFVWKKAKQPLQVVRKNVTLPWFDYDWRNESKQEQEQKINDLLKLDQEKYFELDKAPLLKFHLIRLTEDKYEFINTGHHILSDGWSMTIILKEVFDFYGGIIQNKPVILPIPRPYQDYINWVQKQDQAQAETFWRQTLKGFTSPTPLGVDKPLNHSVNQSTNYVDKKFKISPEITQKLKSLSQENRITLATLIQAAWGLLLHHYSHELDIVFGATVSGRPPSFTGIESMVGVFLNTLPVRLKIEPKTELLSWLKQLQEQHLEREQYSYSSLIDIQKWSEIPAPNSVFESFVVFENLPFAETDSHHLGGLQVGEIRDNGNADYPLTLIVTPGESLSVKIIYPQERFDPDTIEGMGGHFQTLLEGITINPYSPLEELPILTEAERKLLLVDWNETASKSPIKDCFHQLFEQQVSKNPSAIAVVFQEEKLTYQALNQRANQLAHYLQKRGVSSQTLVGICLERSLKMAIAVLAVLKVGGVCVPLDPNYPQERLAYILQNTNLDIVLTQKECQSISDSIVQRILLDEQEPEMALESEENINLKVGLKDLAYLIYTSGSTGVPKGIMIPHQSLTNMIEYHQERTSPERNFLQFASFNFDVSYHEMFAAWGLGGTLFIVPEESRLNLAKLTNLFNNNPIHKAILPVTLLQQLMETYSKEPHLFANFREIMSAGEQLQITQPMIDVFKTLENCTLVNLYGPTEANIVTGYTFDKDPDNWPQYVPIGKPAVNVQVYILNAYLKPVPIGVIGELYIGGEGLALGYFNNPQLTEEKFIPNPFSGNPQSRLYKTGDLARYLPNGDIEYLGRMDVVVKVRGYRIDLGEVEAILNQHPQIIQAVAKVHGETAREKYLVAYFIPRHGETINLLELRHFLEKFLPDYMIPSAFMPMESFPLSPNGKVDRKVLPVPAQNPISSTQNYVAPQSVIEEVISDIWAEILEVEKVGIEDNFFVLGGHSLKAIQLVSKIRQTLEIEVSVRQIFNHPTISQLVKVMEELVGDDHLLNEIALTFQEISQLSPEEVKALLSQT